jgi:3-hydroxy-9,10-secoandrosta-1,3,5(10)-triene-9,17-dione monooxygenase reductase component
MGEFASGVTVVTAAAGKELAGLTANAFSSVSLLPPMVLVCVGSDTHSGGIIRDAGLFAVYVLAADQEDVARRFAKRGAEKFGASDWDSGPSGVPLLRRYLSRFVCRLEAAHEGGDHLIFVGGVESLDICQNATVPLTYFQGRLGALRPRLAAADSL